MANQKSSDTADSLLLNRYRVISLCHKGGFGNVMICWDIRLQRRVAIKQLPLVARDGLNPTSYQDALEEARASSFMSHPNIVMMHDFVSDDEFCYLVMEYVDGMTLTELLSRVENGVLTADEAAAVALSVASALTFAHENGVLHLDIKPGNVMIDKSGAVKLVDFGMASLASAAGYGGARGGTIGFMPPEQLDGGIVDERTDIFSLALLAYQMLSGEAPFKASTPKQSKRLIEKGVPVEKITDYDVADSALYALREALDAEPDARPESINQFLDRLMPGLGDPQKGKESLKALLASDEEAEAFDKTTWSSLDPPARRVPWLVPAISRASNLVIALIFGFFLAHFAANTLFTSMLDLSWICFTVAGILAVLALFIPTVVAAGELWILAVLLIAQNPCTPTLLCAVLVIAFSAWWAIAAGSYNRLSLTGVLSAPAFQSPGITSGLSGYLFSPLPAAFTGALAAACAAVVSTCVTTQRFVPTSQFPALLFGNPVWAIAVLILVAFAALGAGIASGITTSLARQKDEGGHIKGARLKLIIAQLISVGCLGVGTAAVGAFFSALSHGVPVFLWSQATNYSVVELLTYAQSNIQVGFLSVFLVISCVLMCVIVMLFGIPKRARELDEVSERF